MMKFGAKKIVCQRAFALRGNLGSQRTIAHLVFLPTHKPTQKNQKSYFYQRSTEYEINDIINEDNTK